MAEQWQNRKPVCEPAFAWSNPFEVIGDTGHGDDGSGDIPGGGPFEHQVVEFEEIAESLDESVRMLLFAVTGR